MRKLYEIGDQPLPIDRVEEERYSNNVTYYFHIPLQAPEGEFEDSLPMKVLFVHYEFDMRDLGYKGRGFMKGDSSVIPLINSLADQWNIVRQEIPDPYDGADALKLIGYEVLFKGAEDGASWHMQNFKDHTLPIKIMATVKACVTDFIEKHPKLDFVSFLADKDDRGRTLLYDRFSKLISKALGFSTLQLSGSFFEFICINSKKLKDISLRLSKIEKVLDKRKKLANNPETPVQDVDNISNFIQDIADGKVKVLPEQPELFDDI